MSAIVVLDGLDLVNPVRINGADTTWPNSNSAGVLSNNGSGILVWTKSPALDNIVLTVPASTIGIAVTGTALSSTAGNGANASNLFDIVGTTGQASSSTTGGQHGGTGAALAIVGGAGGAATGATGAVIGGDGGQAFWTSGAGGGTLSTSGTGGAGGLWLVRAGAGGAATAATGTTFGGAGGLIVFAGGQGGNTSSANGTGGAGGNAYFYGGIGGTGTLANGVAGATILAHTGSVANGVVGVRTNSPSSSYAMDVNGRVNASSGFNGILTADVPGTDAATASTVVKRDANAFAKIVVPICSLSLTGLQSIQNGSIGDQEVLWGAGTENTDVFGFHDTGTNTGRVTIPTGLGGKYRVYANLQYSSNATGLRGVEIYKNGSFYKAKYSNGVFTGAGNDVDIEIQEPFAAGDYIQIYAYQTTTGGSLNITTNSTFIVTWISA